MDDGERQELRSLIVRLANDADDLGVRHAEVAHLIGLPPGTWPLPLACQWSWEPEMWQETRLRRLGEVCTRLNTLFGADGALWLRRENPALRTTPIAFLLSEPDSLRFLRDALREEADHI